MTTPPLPPARPPSDLRLRIPTRVLDRLEATTEHDLTGTITSTGTPAALRNAAGTVTGTVTRAAQTAHRIGALIARTLTPPPRQRPGEPKLPKLLPTAPGPAETLRLLRDLAIPDAVGRLLDDAATRLDQTTAPVREELDRAARRVWGYALTTIHTASNRGATWYARNTGHDLRWHTREDERVCPTCSPLNGATTAPDTGFTLPTEDGIPKPWPHFTGLPPAHPRCRCSVTPVRPTSPATRRRARFPNPFRRPRPAVT
ncbi:hypothetical protein [Actinomadura nitritigenes]|uniref:hypothetical protein n=1 Tax=Actinomadura nitritigenes TaxID=134602 RepID=UPI003D92D747